MPGKSGLNNITFVRNLQQISALINDLSPSSVFVLVDENTRQHCYPKITPFLPIHESIQITSGEENKTLQICEVIWSKLTSSNADRNTLLINVGGGVVGDIGGFAAGCYKRGIRFINIPTTLLAMVDASVGGKTGIDFTGFKNQLGLFNEPAAVFIHTPFLKTLPERELVSGFAEVIKHYLIADTNSFSEILSAGGSLDGINWDLLVEKNIAIKNQIVTEDPKEKGIRKALNFGHTVGHAVESLFLQNPLQKLLHGEAIAVGMITESFISMKKGLLTVEEMEPINKVILDFFDLPFIQEKDFEIVLSFARQDKKNTGAKLKFTLLNGIGNFSIDNIVEPELVIESLSYYNSQLE